MQFHRWIAWMLVLLAVGNATASPSATPSTAPSSTPSTSPSTSPTTCVPSTAPSSSPSFPSASPSSTPSTSPSASPSTSLPSARPSARPSSQPSARPSTAPSASPSTSFPSIVPSELPTSPPSGSPSTFPSNMPHSDSPSRSPTSLPTNVPTTLPTTGIPTKKVTWIPTKSPSAQPTMGPSHPSIAPISNYPSATPTGSPICPSYSPSPHPTTAPNFGPTSTPTKSPLTAYPTISQAVKPDGGDFSYVEVRHDVNISVATGILACNQSHPVSIAISGAVCEGVGANICVVHKVDGGGILCDGYPRRRLNADTIQPRRLDLDDPHVQSRIDIYVQNLSAVQATTIANLFNGRNYDTYGISLLNDRLASTGYDISVFGLSAVYGWIAPTKMPQAYPTETPTTSLPSQRPSGVPNQGTPTLCPSFPSISPQSDPPTVKPSQRPTFHPSIKPVTGKPSRFPTYWPTFNPSNKPSIWPTGMPTRKPSTSHPSINPTHQPTMWSPTCLPTHSPTTSTPSLIPTSFPISGHPTKKPTTEGNKLNIFIAEYFPHSQDDLIVLTDRSQNSTDLLSAVCWDTTRSIIHLREFSFSEQFYRKNKVHYDEWLVRNHLPVDDTVHAAALFHALYVLAQAEIAKRDAFCDAVKDNGLVYSMTPNQMENTIEATHTTFVPYRGKIDTFHTLTNAVASDAEIEALHEILIEYGVPNEAFGKVCEDHELGGANLDRFQTDFVIYSRSINYAEALGFDWRKFEGEYEQNKQKKILVSFRELDRSAKNALCAMGRQKYRIEINIIVADQDWWYGLSDAVFPKSKEYWAAVMSESANLDRLQTETLTKADPGLWKALGEQFDYTKDKCTEVMEELEENHFEIARIYSDTQMRDWRYQELKVRRAAYECHNYMDPSVDVPEPSNWHVDIENVDGRRACEIIEMRTSVDRVLIEDLGLAIMYCKKAILEKLSTYQNKYIVDDHAEIYCEDLIASESTHLGNFAYWPREGDFVENSRKPFLICIEMLYLETKSVKLLPTAQFCDVVRETEYMNDFDRLTFYFEGRKASMGIVARDLRQTYRNFSRNVASGLVYPEEGIDGELYGEPIPGLQIYLNFAALSGNFIQIMKNQIALEIQLQLGIGVAYTTIEQISKTQGVLKFDITEHFVISHADRIRQFYKRGLTVANITLEVIAVEVPETYDTTILNQYGISVRPTSYQCAVKSDTHKMIVFSTYQSLAREPISPYPVTTENVQPSKQEATGLPKSCAFSLSALVSIIALLLHEL